MLGSAQNTRASTGAPTPPWTATLNEQTRQFIVSALGKSRAEDAIERGVPLNPPQVLERLIDTEPLLIVTRAR
jgi:hypothetical protein